MLSAFSTMSVPVSVTIDTHPAVIWALLAVFVIAGLGVLRQILAARRRARLLATELEFFERATARVSRQGAAARRPLAA